MHRMPIRSHTENSNEWRTTIAQRSFPGARRNRPRCGQSLRERWQSSRLNRLTFDDAPEVRTLFGELIGKPLDDGFLLIPPFYATGGADTRIGRNVFVNQNCTFYDLGGLDIGDDVMIGPNVSLITSGHPVEPSRRRDFVVARPIVIGNNVWIGAGATIIGGVTVGENAVVGAGSVVTRDVPPNTLVGGNPARIIRSVAG